MLYPELLGRPSIVLFLFCLAFLAGATTLQFLALVNAREPETVEEITFFLEQACPILHFSYLMQKIVSVNVNMMKFIEASIDQLIKSHIAL